MVDFIISIITVNYNNLDGLKKTYNSLVSQTNQSNLEWIVIDGNSTDNSFGFLKSITPNFSYCFSSDFDHGIYDAMNKGINKAKGNYFLFLNSGDIFYDTNSLTSIFSDIQDYHFDLILYGFEHNNKIRFPKPLLWRFWSLPTSHQSIIYKRFLFNNNLYSLEYKFASDLDHFLKINTKKLFIKKVRKILIANESYGSNNSLNLLEDEYSKIYSNYYGCFLSRIFMKLKFKYLKIYYNK
jgi:glycosyltransferase involved in cell wall biosynthesis